MSVRTCRYCRRTLETTCFDGDSRVCKECVQNPKHFSKEELESNNSKDLCKYCMQQFISLTKIKKHVCEKCKNETDEYFTVCEKCRQKYSRENNFNLRKLICDECAEAINCEEYFDHTYRYCNECKEYKLIGKEISFKASYCDICDKIRRRARVVAKKKTSWDRHCRGCGKVVVVIVPRATKVYCEECKAKI